MRFNGLDLNLLVVLDALLEEKKNYRCGAAAVDQPVRHQRHAGQAARAFQR